jgi:release factor glutamine methyltransferase
VTQEAVPPGEDLAVALREATTRLDEAGVPAARADAEQLAGHVLGLGRGEVLAAALVGRRWPADRSRAFADLVALRAQRVPLQHLTGRAAFRTLELEVGPGVFVPRPETELVAGLAIEAARALAGDAPSADGGPLVVDLCTGSAAIALAVAVEVPEARVVALEREPLALAWAERNVRASAPGRVDLRAGDVVAADADLLADLVGIVDVVVANPPYIPPGARPVDPEVAEHDPDAALYGGGPDGLDVPRAVVAVAAALLRDGGLLVMEHGDGQGAACRGLAAGPAWSQVRTDTDLTGRDRALVATRTSDRA